MQNQPDRDLDPCLVAPEMLTSNAQEILSSDIWNIGIVLYQIVAGEMPFTGHNFKEIF